MKHRSIAAGNVALCSAFQDAPRLRESAHKCSGTPASRQFACLHGRLISMLNWNDSGGRTRRYRDRFAPLRGVPLPGRLGESLGSSQGLPSQGRRTLLGVWLIWVFFQHVVLRLRVYPRVGRRGFPSPIYPAKEAIILGRGTRLALDITPSTTFRLKVPAQP